MYFDDVEAGRAIVYLGTPCVSECRLVAYSSIREATADEEREWMELVGNDVARARALAHARS